MNSKGNMTAVEWYDRQLLTIDLRLKSESITFGEYLELRGNLYKQAKQMEKEQIFNSYEAGFKDEYFEPNEYYNETFKS